MIVVLVFFFLSFFNVMIRDTTFDAVQAVSLTNDVHL